MKIREILLTFTLWLASSLCSAQTSDSLIVNQLRGKGVSFSHDNSVTLLMSGQEKFDDISVIVYRNGVRNFAANHPLNLCHPVRHSRQFCSLSRKLSFFSLSKRRLSW